METKRGKYKPSKYVVPSQSFVKVKYPDNFVIPAETKISSKYLMGLITAHLNLINGTKFTIENFRIKNEQQTNENANNAQTEVTAITPDTQNGI